MCVGECVCICEVFFLCFVCICLCVVRRFLCVRLWCGLYMCVCVCVESVVLVFL